MRKINIDIQGYPNIMDNTFLQKVANRKHPMAKLPSYSKKDEPTKYHEEHILESRFKELVDSYSNTFSVEKENIFWFEVMMNAGNNGMAAIMLEKPHRPKLIKLAEKIIREQYNLSEDEVLFDLEIVDPGQCKFPEEMNKNKKVDDDFEQTDDLDALKKRTINALSQGAAKKSHYIFHLYGEEMDKISKDLSTYYQKALIANDLFYYIMNDDMLSNMMDSDDDSANAGYVKLNFDGPIPVIEAKAINFPILIHEMTKGCISLFSVPGIQNMTQETIDETDFVMAELYEIRFGPTIWQSFHSAIDVDDYDVKKLIMVELFKKDSEEFHEFMNDVLNKPDEAQKEIKRIAKDIKMKIMNYEFEKESNEDLPDVDFSQFGF
jgi:hypothetical protein